MWTSEISNLLNVTRSCAEKLGWRRVSVGFIWLCSALRTVSIFYRCVLICSGKKIKTNNKTNSKQAKPTKQRRENSDKLFLTALSFFIYVCRRLIFGRIMSAACFRCCLAEVKILLSRCLRVYECSLSMQIMSGKTWFFRAILLIDNHTTYASCVIPNDGCLGMTSVMSVKVLLGMHKPFKYTL